MLELHRYFLGERGDEVPAEGVGDSGKGVDAAAGTSALPEAGDHRLRRAHPFGELTLAEPGLRTQVVDEPT